MQTGIPHSVTLTGATLRALLGFSSRGVPVLGDGDEIPEMSEFHGAPMPAEYDTQPTRSFSKAK
jgi:hypothetical protein